MLVLSRKKNQTIDIGDNVSVTVLRTSIGRVQLAIEAPDDVRIVRREIKHRKPTAGSPAAAVKGGS